MGVAEPGEIAEWAEVRKTLLALNIPVFAAFDQFYESLDPLSRAHCKVIVASYQYGQKVIDRGRPRLPNGDDFDESFVVSADLPFGIIIKNSFEVIDYSLGNKDAFASQAILQRSDSIGLFELHDFLTDIRFPSAPQWTISAGASSIYTTVRFGTDAVQAKIKKKFNFVGSGTEETLPDQLMEIEAFQEAAKSWDAQIVFFAKAWFFDVKRGLGKAPHMPALELYWALASQSWRSLSRVRYNPDILYACHSGGRKNVPPIAVSTFLKAVDDVLSGRRPCFVPVDADDAFGPFGVATTIIAAADEQGVLLRPAYLSAGGTGFLPLNHILSGVLPDTMTMRNSIVEILKELQKVYDASRGTKGLPVLLDDFSDLLKCLLFKAPARDKGKTKEEVFAYDYNSKSKQIRPVKKDQQQFFESIIDKKVPERCAFFRGSIRLTRPLN